MEMKATLEEDRAAIADNSSMRGASLTDDGSGWSQEGQAGIDAPIEGHGPAVPARVALQLKGCLPQRFGNQECVDRTLFECRPNHLLTIGGLRMCLDELLQEGVHQLTLSVEFDLPIMGPALSSSSRSPLSLE